MQERLNMQKVCPDAYEGILKMEEYLSQTALKPEHKELIKLRASLINNCAYCIDMHSRDLKAKGESEYRLYLVSAWKETHLFSEEEKLIFTITEELTLLSNGGLHDDTYNKAIAIFGEDYLSHIIVAVCTINVWNRIAVATNMGALVKAS